MPKFHFNLYDGNSGLDDDGSEVENIKTARIEAISLAGRLLAENPQALLSCEDWRMELVDDHGLILFAVTVIPHFTAAAQR